MEISCVSEGDRKKYCFKGYLPLFSLDNLNALILIMIFAIIKKYRALHHNDNINAYIICYKCLYLKKQLCKFSAKPLTPRHHIQL